MQKYKDYIVIAISLIILASIMYILFNYDLSSFNYKLYYIFMKDKGE